MSRCTCPPVLAAALLLGVAGPAAAAPQLLGDHELRAVYGRADVAAAPSLPLPGVNGGPVAQVADDLLKGAHVMVLDGPQFLAAWRAAGATEAPATYAGQPVLQLSLAGPPVSVTFDGNELLGSLAGGGTLHGPSVGQFTFHDLDARGTTLWLWHH